MVDKPKCEGESTLLYPFDARIAWVAACYRRTSLRITWDLCSSGARVAMGPAPFRETMAAQLIMLARWDARTEPLVDPMAGGGAIPIEAAGLAVGAAIRKPLEFPLAHFAAFEDVPIHALDDDAVFNVVGEVLPAAQVERVLRDYYAGRLGDEDLEVRLLRNVDEGQFRAICKNALEGLASKKLNLEMLIERRALAQERRVVPETIARFLREAAEFVPFTLKSVPSLPHAFDPARTPMALRRYEKDPDWKLPGLADRYPRCSTDRETAELKKLEWVTPGHPLFEAVRRHTQNLAMDVLGKGATFHSLQHEQPARIDFYRARIVDGLGQVIHERLFAIEINELDERIREEPGLRRYQPGSQNRRIASD